MQTVSPILDALFRWVHVLFGVIWLGYGFFFSFVVMPMLAKLEPDVQRRLVPEMLPRSMFWFKISSILAYVFGLLLLMLVFYHGKLAFANVQGASGYVGPIAMILFSLLLAPVVYDLLVNSALGKNPKALGAALFALLALTLLLMIFWAKFEYRTANIHIGAMLGSITAFNTLFRLLPGQRQLVAGIKAGTPPDPAKMAGAMLRARHNSYMGVTILWTMIGAHTFSFAGGAMGMTDKTWWIGFLIVTLLGWHVIFQLFKRAGKLQGA